MQTCVVKKAANRGWENRSVRQISRLKTWTEGGTPNVAIDTAAFLAKARSQTSLILEEIVRGESG